MGTNEPEKVEVMCPECGTKNEILFFPSNKIKVEKPGTRAGRSIAWSGRGEKVMGKCTECEYKFNVDDL